MLRNCIKCNALFDSKNCPDCNRRRAAQYYTSNKERHHKYSAAWCALNPAKKNGYAAAYRARNRPKQKEYSAAYRVDNRAKEKERVAVWCAKNTAKVAAKQATWRSNNHEKCLIYGHNRRSRLKASGRLSQGLAAKLYALQKGKCVCCNKPLGKDYHLDHIAPLTLGGKNIDSNMQLLRSTCNLEKHAKPPEQFMRQRGFLL